MCHIFEYRSAIVLKTISWENFTAVLLTSTYFKEHLWMAACVIHGGIDPTKIGCIFSHVKQR